MAILPPAQPYRSDFDPSQVMRTCEAPDCDVSKPQREMYSVVVMIAVHPAAAPPIRCPAEQHYGCTLEHAKLVAHACLDEHVAVGE